MVSTFIDDVVISKLSIPSDKDNIMQMNEEMHVLEKNIRYNTEEIQANVIYTLFEITINTANKKQVINFPVLLYNEKMIKATGFENNTFEKIDSDITINDEIDKSLDFASAELKDTLKSAEKDHEKDMAELIAIRDEHAEQKYEELRGNEQLLLNKIEDARSSAMRASSFAAQGSYNDKIKSMQKKYNALIVKNNKQRAKVKADAQLHMGSLKNRELEIVAKVLAYASVQMEIFHITFDDGSQYYYLPAIKKFMMADTKSS